MLLFVRHPRFPLTVVVKEVRAKLFLCDWVDADRIRPSGHNRMRFADLETNQRTLESVSNLFNTHADRGLCPLEPSIVRGRLIWDLLFCNKLLVPDISLLCNPATAFLLADGVLPALFQEGRVKVLCDDQAQSFSSLLSSILERRDAALLGHDAEYFQHVAAELDRCVLSSNRCLLPTNDLRSRKTEVSRRFLNGLQELVPSRPKLLRTIRTEFERELDARGVVDSTWWQNLHTCLIPELKNSARQLRALATYHFDLSYCGRQRPLIGHSYGQTPSDFFREIVEFMPQVSIQIAHTAKEGRPLPGIQFADLCQMHVTDLKRVLYECQDARTKYEGAMRALRSDGTEDALNQAMARLDELVIALATHLKLSELTEFANQTHELSRLQSRLCYIKTGRHVCKYISLAAVVVAGTAASRASVFECLILLGVAHVASVLSEKLVEKGRCVKVQREEANAQLNQGRVVSLQLPIR